MQELILVISRCVSKRKSVKGEKSFYRFHFKGYYAGEKVKVIHLFSSGNSLFPEQLSKGDDYLLWVKRKRVYLEVLEVELIKYKKII
ncbi:MAG: hypothetical protein PHY93_01635 [Bacteriovorax sp.]|nr:hypothetical protein [Bacteriovorax sp.]